MKLYRKTVLPEIKKRLNSCNDDEAVKYLKWGLRYILAKGHWKHTTDRVCMKVDTSCCCLTLPSKYETIEAYWVPNGRGEIGGEGHGYGSRTRNHSSYVKASRAWKPVRIRNEWFEAYQEGMSLEGCSECGADDVISRGTNFVTFDDIRQGERILVKADHSHEELTIQLGGIQADGREVVTFDGEERIGGERIPLKYESAVLSQTVWAADGLKHVQKPITHGAVTLYAVNDRQQMRPIAVYQGEETEPCFRRYHVPKASGCNQVIAQLKKACPPLNHDDEELPFTNEEAIMIAAQRAYDIEKKNFVDARAATVLLIELIDDELDNHQGENTEIPINIDGACWFQGDLDTI